MKRIRPPRQPRSEATRQRIGRALAELLAERPLAEITIAEICARASASPSSFYARFADKAAAVAWLRDEYFADSSRALGERLDADRWEGLSLEELVRELMKAYVTFLRGHEHVLRALALENRTHPGSPEAARSREQNLASYRRITELLLTRRDEILHEDPEFAVTFGLASVFATSHELVLFAAAAMHPLRLTDDELVAALTASYLSLLKPSRGAS